MVASVNSPTTYTWKWYWYIHQDKFISNTTSSNSDKISSKCIIPLFVLLRNISTFQSHVPSSILYNYFFHSNTHPSGGKTSAQTVQGCRSVRRTALGEWLLRKILISSSLPFYTSLLSKLTPPSRSSISIPSLLKLPQCFSNFKGIYNPHHNPVFYTSASCLCMCVFSSLLFYNMIIIIIKQLTEAATYTNATVQLGKIKMCLETEVLILKSLLHHLLRM